MVCGVQLVVTRSDLTQREVDRVTIERIREIAEIGGREKLGFGD